MNESWFRMEGFVHVSAWVRRLFFLGYRHLFFFCPSPNQANKSNSLGRGEGWFKLTKLCRGEQFTPSSPDTTALIWIGTAVVFLWGKKSLISFHGSSSILSVFGTQLSNCIIAASAGKAFEKVDILKNMWDVIADFCVPELALPMLILGKLFKNGAWP